MTLTPDVEAELEEALIPLRAEGLTAEEAAGRLPRHLVQPFWERAVDRYLDEQLKLAEALEADGYNPVPYAGQEWVDKTVTWLPEGHRSIVTITSLGKTVSGWQARVLRRQVDADGRYVSSGDGDGVIHLDRLVADFERVPRS